MVTGNRMKNHEHNEDTREELATTDSDIYGEINDHYENG